MELKNSTILITGGTSGIGLELVKQLTGQGARIIVTGRRSDALNETKKKFPDVHTFQSDVSNPKDIEQLYKDVIQQFPDLNVIINNAGLMRLIDLQDASFDLENITREIGTNLTGTIQMVHQFLPHLVTKKSAAIVNVSSGIAFMPYSIAPVYSAAKAGVRAYTQALRLQLEETNVKVFEMIPPGVNTNLQNDWSVAPNPRMMMEADKMVAVAVKGLLKDKKELKPLLISVIKAASRLVPGLLMKFGNGEFKNSKNKIKAINNENRKYHTPVNIGFLSIKHGWDAFQPPHAAQAKMMENLGITKNAMYYLGALSALIGVMLFFPQTFFIANVLNALTIVLIMALSLRAGDYKTALIEIPFLALPLILIWLKYPALNN